MKSRLYILILFSVNLISLVLNAQEWQTDFNKTKEIAKENNQNIILLFSGSDWCAPCIKLENEIWSSYEFKSYAKGKFVLLRADFPKKKKNRLTNEQQEKNNQLAEIYNKNGFFPFVVVLNSDGKVLGTTGYKNITPKEYIKIFTPFFLNPIRQVFNKKIKLMGSRFDITIVERDSIAAYKYIDTAIAEIMRIEKIISSWDMDSETAKINNGSEVKPIKVSNELFELIERSLAISQLTDGAFDISYASMDKIWKFDGSMIDLPTKEYIKQSVEKVGYENIILNKANQTVFFKIEGMKIGFGGIGKGFVADKAKELLISKGVKAGIINASGDMNTWGKQPNGEDWKVAITNPLNKEEAFALLPITNGAVATSGNYEKYIIFNGTRYSHIINPKTGMPSIGIISVSVFAESAELADALATSIFVMGSEVGINRINQIPNVDCIIIDDNGNIKTSKNINIHDN